jgi:hypothetical protein
MAAAVASTEFFTGHLVRASHNFTAGPSVRLLPPTASIPYGKVEIRWSANFAGDGKVEIFDNADGTGPPVVTKLSSSPSPEHTIAFDVLGVVQADTTYYFKVTHHDPTNSLIDKTNDPAPFPSFFTGAQAIGNVFVDHGVDRALIQWDANVIGFGRLEYGIASTNEFRADDQANFTSHNIELTGLAPGTTYQYRVCNRHAIDGDCLASETGSFTTLGSPTPTPTLTPTPTPTSTPVPTPTTTPTPSPTPLVYNFTGFFQPVDNLPVLNIATANSAIPVKFSLGGDQGLAVFAPGYPASGEIACNASEPGTAIEETVTAGGSSLSYDAVTGVYTYLWITNRAWRGTCRTLVVRFVDGTDHSAKFRFR